MSEAQTTFCGCCYFFCPPFPNQIAERTFFKPPSPPFYVLESVDSEHHDYVFMPSPEVDATGLRKVLNQRARLVKTTSGNDISVLYVNCNQEKKYTILYSHGISVDLGQIHKLCSDMSKAFMCDVVCYDYSGYGRSNGEPTEENLYADIKAAWDYTLAFHEPRAEKIILFGHSLGTAPTIDLATKVQCGGVILQSPFKSSLSVACPNRKPWSCMDRLKNIEKVPKVTSRVLVIHGTDDEIINFSDGQEIYERCQQTVEPLWIEGAGHYDIEFQEQYVERIRKFINEELLI